MDDGRCNTPSVPTHVADPASALQRGRSGAGTRTATGLLGLDRDGLRVPMSS
jgi:hypothetical protein